MTDWTEADLEQNKKLNDIVAKLVAVSAKLETLHAKIDTAQAKLAPLEHVLAPLEHIVDLVDKIWDRLKNLIDGPLMVFNSARSKPPSRDFAGPGRSYPVENASHAEVAKGFAKRALDEGRMRPAEYKEIVAHANETLEKK